MDEQVAPVVTDNGGPWQKYVGISAIMFQILKGLRSCIKKYQSRERPEAG
jgi:hypothetical protein